MTRIVQLRIARRYLAVMQAAAAELDRGLDRGLDQELDRGLGQP